MANSTTHTFIQSILRRPIAVSRYRFELRSLLWAVGLTALLLGVLSPALRIYYSINAGKNRVAKRLDHQQLLIAGRMLLARAESAGEKLEIRAELPAPIAESKPTDVFISGDRLYLEYGGIAATYGLVIVPEGQRCESIAQIIEGVYFYDVGSRN